MLIRECVKNRFPLCLNKVEWFTRVHTLHSVKNTMWLVIFARDLFAFFVSQDPFANGKTAKHLLSMCKVNNPCFNSSYLELSSRKHKRVGK